MGKKYDPGLWDFDSFLDSRRYEDMRWCVNFIEGQIGDFDDRNATNHYEKLSPQIQRAFLLTIVAHMEHHLKKLCDILAERRNLVVRTVDMRGANGFESCIAYLKKVLQIPIPEKIVKTVRGIVLLRNAIVHDGGYLDALPKIDSEVFSTIELVDGQLLLAAPFVSKATMICGKFVDSIVEAVGDQKGPKAPLKGQRKPIRS